MRLPDNMKEKIYWMELPLRESSQKAKVDRDPDLEKALKTNLTSALHKELKIIAGTRMNLILSWFGLQGWGKSYSMIDVFQDFSKYRGIDLDVNNVCFTVNDALRVIETVDKGSAILLDEQTKTAGVGSSIEKVAIKNIELTVRAHRLCLGFASPEFVPHNYHYLFETLTWGSDEPIDFDIDIGKQWKFTKLIIYNNDFYPIGYIITDTPDNTKFLKDYEKKKDDAIYLIRQQYGGGRYIYLKSLADKFFKSRDENENLFLERYLRVKGKDTKAFIVSLGLKNPLMSVVEQRRLVGYIDLLLQENPSLLPDRKFFPRNKNLRGKNFNENPSLLPNSKVFKPKKR